MAAIDLRHADCRDALIDLALDGIQVDAVCTDPPYHLTSVVKRFGGANAAPAKHGSDGLFARQSKGFMGKTWDGGDIAFDVETWRAVYAVMKPGAHLVAFGGTRTYHRMACAIEDAGFEVRDTLMWLYGTGFPKSHDVSKGIDRELGAEREKVPPRSVIGHQRNAGNVRPYMLDPNHMTVSDVPATPEGARWQGWGTALKPAFEPILVAQKPHPPQVVLAQLVAEIGEWMLSAVSFARTDTPLSALLRESGFSNIALSLSGTLGALSGLESRFTTETAIALITDLKTLRLSTSEITRACTTQDQTPADGITPCVSLASALSLSVRAKCARLRGTTAGAIAIDWHAAEGTGPGVGSVSPAWEPIILARKPLAGTVATNVLQHGVGALNIDGCRIPGSGSTIRQNSGGTGNPDQWRTGNGGGFTSGSELGRWPANVVHDGSDEVETAFAAFGEKGGGHWPDCKRSGGGGVGTGTSEYKGAGLKDGTGSASRFFYSAKASAADRAGSKHPTVKPVDLIRWLVRMVTSPGGLVLDPFSGSGTTGAAAVAEGMRAVLIERESEYAADICRRLGLPVPASVEIAEFERLLA